MRDDRRSQTLVAPLLSVLGTELVMRGDGVGRGVAEVDASCSEADAGELQRLESQSRKEGEKNQGCGRTVEARSICLRASASSSFLKTRGSISTVVRRAQREKTSETERRTRYLAVIEVHES